jgi:hypothetical protein
LNEYPDIEVKCAIHNRFIPVGYQLLPALQATLNVQEQDGTGADCEERGPFVPSRHDDDEDDDEEEEENYNL